MPTSYQAFASKRSTWAPHINQDDEAGSALRSIFGTADEITLSRSDLRSLAAKADLVQFILATIIWGYPSGMRGNNVTKLIGHLNSLAQLLSSTRTEPVTKWSEHYAEVELISGVGLSTYTKFLSFLSVRVQGHTALILDNRIIRIANKGIFDELAPLKELSDYNKVRFYPQYLECMHDVADNLAVTAEEIEFFLFEFGLYLKPPIAQHIGVQSTPILQGYADLISRKNKT